MFRALYSAASGMFAQEANMEQLSEDLANAATNGYKKSRVNFEDLMYSEMGEPGALGALDESTPVGSQIGAGVRAGGVEKLFTAGELYHTGNALDLGIHGDGFFEVTVEDGRIGYTRDGVIRISKDGTALAGGHPLVGVKIPQNASGIEVSDDGTIKANLNDPNKKEIIGHIKLARFLNPAGLRLEGNVFLQSPVSGAKVAGTPGEQGLGTIQAGYVEKSNVNLVEAMMNMVMAQRMFEFNAKAVSTTDEMMRMTTQLPRAS